jgi:hypothetical protein
VFSNPALSRYGSGATVQGELMPGVTCGCGQVVKVTQLSQKEIKIELSTRNVKGCAELRRLREDGQAVDEKNFECPRLAAAIQFNLTMKKAQTW